MQDKPFGPSTSKGKAGAGAPRGWVGGHMLRLGLERARNTCIATLSVVGSLPATAAIIFTPLWILKVFYTSAHRFHNQEKKFRKRKSSAVPEDGPGPLPTPAALSVSICFLPPPAIGPRTQEPNVKGNSALLGALGSN